jgi:mRNA-degrading endonuclease HigB of HigAB toxin-antitoxin module
VFNTPEQLKNTFSAQYNTELTKNELKPLEKMIAKTKIPAPENVKSQFKNGEISFNNVKVSKNEHGQTLVQLDLDTKGFNKKEHKNLEFVL